jgi:hypothetical protein
LVTCSKLEEFTKTDNHYYRLGKGQRKRIEDELGCLFPCTYTEYQVSRWQNGLSLEQCV